ncbi:TlpA family protein disulfide reductase [Pseudactinotalea sp.]|uniref:TlpA family protein disulfide reductase n=1 Tax=Pseudactinotalea sp. TaxID=1926260 RepID=UPI003B3A963C
MTASRRTVLLGALGLLGAGALTACSDDEAPTDSDGVDTSYVSGDGTATEWAPDRRTAPVELAGATMAGDDVDLADWRGEVVVLNFWYATCPPCRKEAPDLASLSTELEPEGVQFLGVNHTDEPDTALAFERTFELPYPTLHDSDASGVAALQGVVPLQAMPSTVVLDAQGRVAARIIGLAERSTLKAMIDTVLAES